MFVDTPIGAMMDLSLERTIHELELPLDDLDVIAGGAPHESPHNVRCDKNYCPNGYCEAGYSSK